MDAVLTPADLSAIAEQHPELGLLALLGSRARGTAHPGSDWDLGFLGGEALDVGTLAADLMAALGSDEVDVVDLARASAVLRRDAAGHGVTLWERTPGTFVDFAVEASLFWCDIEPVLRRAHADVLRSFAR